jgi:hypothetical protein
LESEDTYRVPNDHINTPKSLDRFMNEVLAISEDTRIALKHSSLDAVFLLQALGERICGFRIARVVDTYV